MVLELSVSHSDDVANTGKDNLLMAITTENIKMGLRDEFRAAYQSGSLPDKIGLIIDGIEYIGFKVQGLYAYNYSAPFMQVKCVRIRITC